MSKSNDKDLSGNASLLSQLSELQDIERKYGRETTAEFLKNGLERLEVNVTTEKAEGFLEIAQTLQNRDARVGYIVKDLEDRTAKAAAEISNRLQQPSYSEEDIFDDELEEQD
ncbi:hypothetical protein HLH17_06645 [Acinetobacter sp. ANC 5380]|uniref:Uncharacterized protein n=1 Tax=Acinetobacter terrae TaxID=2731247 RepID=A0A7Y2REV9_9GAMM|nr:hypothetical protein [Acinetobacter terrae]NNH77354.1 hypothetical protein [Acinetobacter terrae]